MRIGVVSAYFSLFDKQMPPDFRARQERAAAECTRQLRQDFEVVLDTGLLNSAEEGTNFNAVFREAKLDALVVAPVMAAPPAYATAALQGLVVPIVIWNAPTVDRLDDDLDQARAHEHTTLVGALMLANVFARQRRAVHVVTARPDEPRDLDRLKRTIRAVAAASRLRGRTALRIGDPVDGYLDIEASAAHLKVLGLEEQAVTRTELEAEFDAVCDDDLAAIRASIEAQKWHGMLDDRAVRLAAALRRLLERHHPICATVNCHGPLLRGSERIGIPACLGMSLCTAEGVPFSCTGDQTASICLALARSMAGAALYCEFYASELASGLVLVANGGEGDPAFAAGDVRIGPSAHYPGVNGGGSALDFALATGPVTALSLTPVGDSWRLVWSPGEIVEARYPRMRAPNGMFAFRSEQGNQRGDCVSRWIASGATHHTVLVRGHLDVEVPLVAQTLNIEQVEV